MHSALGTIIQHEIEPDTNLMYFWFGRLKVEISNSKINWPDPTTQPCHSWPARGSLQTSLYAGCFIFCKAVRCCYLSARSEEQWKNIFIDMSLLIKMRASYCVEDGYTRLVVTPTFGHRMFKKVSAVNAKNCGDFCRSETLFCISDSSKIIIPKQSKGWIV